jgi:hypothetical protein
VALLLLAVACGCILIKFVLEENEDDRQLQAAIAEADRLDPGWRYEDLEARRIIPPPEVNAAILVALAGSKAMALLNAGTMREDVYDLAREFDLLRPRARLTEKQIASLRASLASAIPVLVEARKVANLPRGNVILDWAPDPIFILLRHADDCTIVCWLLSMDASLRAEDGDLAGAWISCEATLNAARSSGDEPFVQLARVRRHRVDALTGMERVLGQGELPEPALASTQKKLEEEATHPALLISLRGHRAHAHYVFSALQAGKVSLARFKKGSQGEPDPKEQVQAYFSRHEITPAHAWLITYWTRAVEIAKGPPEQQQPGFTKLQKEVAGAPAMSKPILRANEISHFMEADAILGCAIAALAVERYRLKHGRWPDALDDLVAAQLLRRVPVDPFDNKPLRYRPTNDGIVVYSIGRDGDGDGTGVERKNRARVDNDLSRDFSPEFRLWNSDQRGQP